MIKISRFAVESFISCKRCFVLSYKFKVKLRTLPFTLNSAVDNLCKNEFDFYRKHEKPHPLFKEHNIDAVPFKHEKMDDWRNNWKGIFYQDKAKGYHFYGAVDDVWVKPDNELIIADVKSTAKNNFNWEETWNKWEYPKGYKRQLEMYQWLFRRNGFKVSNTAYILYFNGLKNQPMFNQELKFEKHLIPLECDDSWVEKKIIEALETLKSDELPKGTIKCDTCLYIKERWKQSKK